MRKPLGAKERWEILQRDNFTCQYCGVKGQDAVLHIDHVVSVADGGTNDWRNLKTACAECNVGKGAESLYRYDHFVSAMQRQDYTGAIAELVRVTVDKFKGVDRQWAESLISSLEPERALYAIEWAEDWKSAVHNLCAQWTMFCIEEHLPEAKRTEYAKLRRETLLRVWKQWAKPSAPLVSTSTESN